MSAHRSLIVISSQVHNCVMKHSAKRLDTRLRSVTVSHLFSFHFVSVFCFRIDTPILIIFCCCSRQHQFVLILVKTTTDGSLSDVHPIIVILLRYLLLFTLDHDLFFSFSLLSLFTSFSPPFSTVFFVYCKHCLHVRLLTFQFHNTLLMFIRVWM